jgi:DNA topoisomerase-1
VSKNLVIVESPAKARTIEKILGEEYTVMSSYGHVRDLPGKGMAVDIENNFEPTYEVSDDKSKVINELKRASRKAEMVWLASDEDREGEAIAWHLEQVLELDKSNSKRIVFHEITRPAILSAIDNPRDINRDLVNGQQARRILDRLVGFELSPVLWKKIQTGLSAGRVQSVAVRIVVEREREIEAFEAVSSFRVTAQLANSEGVGFEARLPKDRLGVDDAEALLQRVEGADYTIRKIEKRPASRSPRAPFTTSTLQQEASQRLGFSVRQTMMVAQRLYEAGKITYMRTDSVNLSELAHAQAQEVIEQSYGSEYAQQRHYKTQSAGAQEAHEAIRPTDLSKATTSGEKNEQRLYELIWQRTIASQMSDARFERTTATIDISTVEEQLVAKGEILTFEGFLKVYQDRGKEDAKRLPAIHEGESLSLSVMRAQETFTRPPARFTEASLVKRLEELGIGRPSTYAPTISTIQNRGYVTRGEQEGRERTLRILLLQGESITREERVEMTGSDKGKLIPQDIAGVVTDFLIKHFSEVIDYNFTARVEGEFDEIALGRLEWREMLGRFYGPFHKDVEDAEDISREEASQTRQLGIDPKSGRPVSVKIGRFGSYAQIGTRDDEEKPLFAGLRPDQRKDSVTLEEVLPLFELPRQLGSTPDGETVMVNTGRFGPYAGFVDEMVRDHLEANPVKGIELLAQNVSIEPEDPHTIELERAIEFIEKKKASDREKEIRLFEGSAVQILDGRWGPFITNGFKNVKPPADSDPASLTQEQCQELLDGSDKERKRLTKQFHGGGFTLIREADGPPDATLKVKEGREAKALEIVEALEHAGKSIRLISANGAAALRAAEKRAATAAAKKKAAPKKSVVKKRAVKKKVARKRAIKKKVAK